MILNNDVNKDETKQTPSIYYTFKTYEYVYEIGDISRGFVFTVREENEL